MDTPLEKIAAEILKDLEKYKTADCLDVSSIGEYIEHSLPSEEWDRVEKHLRSCLYCLDQLVELRELLYLEKTAEPLPLSLMSGHRPWLAQKRLSIWKTFFAALKGYTVSMVEAIRIIFNYRYLWQGTCALLLVVLLVTYFGRIRGAFEEYNAVKSVSNSIVRLRVMDTKGVISQEGTGLVVDADGVVAAPLHLLAGNASGDVVTASGAYFPIEGVIGEDPNSDLAVIKVKVIGRLQTAKISDLSRITAGEKVITISRPTNDKPEISDAVISNVIPSNPKGRISKQVGPDQTRQFIQVVPISKGIRQGVLINQNGEAIGIGILSSENEKVGFAIPVDYAKNILKSPHAPTPLDEIKDKGYSPTALWYFFNGLLAYYSDDYDKAIEYYKKCLAIDSRYDPAHVELGQMYYRKRNYEQEVFHYNEAIKLNPQNKDAHFYLAQAYEYRGEDEMAIKEFEQVLGLDPDDEETLSNLGLDYALVGRFDKAREQYEALRNIHEEAANRLKRFIDMAVARVPKEVER